MDGGARRKGAGWAERLSRADKSPHGAPSSATEIARAARAGGRARRACVRSEVYARPNGSRMGAVLTHGPRGRRRCSWRRVSSGPAPAGRNRAPRRRAEISAARKRTTPTAGVPGRRLAACSVKPTRVPAREHGAQLSCRHMGRRSSCFRLQLFADPVWKRLRFSPLGPTRCGHSHTGLGHLSGSRGLW